MLKLREATARDAVAIANLHAKSWRRIYDGIFTDHYLNNILDQDRVTEWRTRLSAPSEGMYTVVLESKSDPNGLVGFACAYGAHDPVAGTLLENLHVQAQQKQKGAGRYLLEHIAQWSLRNYPNQPLHLWVVEKNVAAIGFYEHMGAVPDARSIWNTPDGSQVPEVRYLWRNPPLRLDTI